MKQFNNSNTGQVVLMLVLITIVGLTIGLSLISRSVTDIRISSQIEQSGRAFSAAEAGVETALKAVTVNGTSGTITLPGASADYSVTSVGGSTNSLTFPLTEVGSSQTVWLIPHHSDGTINEAGPWDSGNQPYPTTQSLDICFTAGAMGNPAVIATIYYKEASTYKVAKKAYDSQVRNNNFILADTGSGYCDGAFNFKKTISPVTDGDPATDDFGINSSATLLVLTIQPVYASASLAVKPSFSLPIQGSQITSVGQTSTGVVRKVQVNQGYPVLPQVFNFAFFCENNCL